jgi:hypothetical protein
MKISKMKISKMKIRAERNQHRPRCRSRANLRGVIQTPAIGRRRIDGSAEAGLSLKLKLKFIFKIKGMR